MDDESDESVEPMGEVPLVGLGESDESLSGQRINSA